MIVTANELTSAIKALLKNKTLDETLEVILPELNEVQLQNVIQSILDPTFKEKQNVLTSPQRFTTKGEVEVVKEFKDYSVPDTLSSEPINTLRVKLTDMDISDEETENILEIKQKCLSQEGRLAQELK